MTRPNPDEPCDGWQPGPPSPAIWNDFGAWTPEGRETMSETKSALDEIAVERRRQIEVEGWTAEHDEWHDGGELARAAGCYALHAGARGAWSESSYRNSAPLYHDTIEGREPWPFSSDWWKPTNPRRDLIKAGALILAEIERLDRLAAREA